MITMLDELLKAVNKDSNEKSLANIKSEINIKKLDFMKLRPAFKRKTLKSPKKAEKTAELASARQAKKFEFFIPRAYSHATVMPIEVAEKSEYFCKEQGKM